jgi:hypothetical protein
MVAEVRYNDNVPSGFNDGSTGKPGGLVPNGDQFSIVYSNDGIYAYYTFYSTVRPGLSLPTQDYYWLVLSLFQPSVFGWTAETNNDTITLDKVYYTSGSGEIQLHSARTGMITMWGCCDPSPSPSRMPPGTRRPTPSVTATPSSTPSFSPTPSTSPFALPVAIASGEVYTNGEPDVEVVTMSTSDTTATTQCAGNIVVGLSGTGIRFSYFIRLTGSAAATGTTITVMAYVVDMSTGTTLAQVDVTARMPTAANDSYTEVIAEASASSSLVARKSYWLPFCFTTTTVTTRGLVARQEGSIGIGGVSSSGSKTTVGFCSGGPTCEPDLQEGSLATAIARTDTGGGGGDDNTVAIAVGVAVPVALVLIGLVAFVVVYLAYKRARNRLELMPPERRRSSVKNTSLEREVQRSQGNDLFEMKSVSTEQHHKLNRQSWVNT